MFSDPRANQAIREQLTLNARLAFGDVIVKTYPDATANLPATTSAWSKEIYVHLATSSGQTHESASGIVATGVVSIADTSTAGTATVASADLRFENGVAKITVYGDAAAWVAAETITVTIADFTLFNTSLTGGTVVYTVV